MLFDLVARHPELSRDAELTEGLVSSVAIVIGERPIPKGTALALRLTGNRRFLPLVDLLLSGDPLAYLTDEWDGALYSAPGGRRVAGVKLPPDTHVHVLASTRSAGRLWLRIETTPGCEGSDGTKTPPQRGWVRAAGIRGAPSVWFHSRGC